MKANTMLRDWKAIEREILYVLYVEGRKKYNFKNFNFHAIKPQYFGLYLCTVKSLTINRKEEEESLYLK